MRTLNAASFDPAYSPVRAFLATCALAFCPRCASLLTLDAAHSVTFRTSSAPCACCGAHPTLAPPPTRFFILVRTYVETDCNGIAYDVRECQTICASCATDAIPLLDADPSLSLERPRRRIVHGAFPNAPPTCRACGMH